MRRSRKPDEDADGYRLRIFSLHFSFYVVLIGWFLTGTPARCRPGNFLVTTGKANISLYYCFFFSLCFYIYLHMSCYKNILNCFYYFRVECVASLIRSHYKSCNKKIQTWSGEKEKVLRSEERETSSGGPPRSARNKSDTHRAERVESAAVFWRRRRRFTQLSRLKPARPVYICI